MFQLILQSNFKFVKSFEECCGSIVLTTAFYWLASVCAVTTPLHSL